MHVTGTVDCVPHFLYNNSTGKESLQGLDEKDKLHQLFCLSVCIDYTRLHKIKLDLQITYHLKLL